MPSREAWLVLDVDDTLVDTYATAWCKCAETARILGLGDPGQAEFTSRYGSRPFEECVIALHPGVDLGRYTGVYDSMATRFPPQPIGDVHAAADTAAAAGFRLGVLTNGPAGKTLRKLRAAGLDPASLEFICSADDRPVRKPHVAAFKRLIDEFGISAERSWYVSDQPADWLGAAQAGLGVAAVVSGSPHVPARGLVPQLIAADLNGIADCLAALPGPVVPRRHPADPVTAVGLDAGFTLIEHVLSPEQILHEVLRLPWPPTSPGAAPPAAEAWASDAAIASALTSSYAAYHAGVAGSRPAADPGQLRKVMNAYAAPPNWRPRAGATELLRRIRSAGLASGVLGNWQSNLPDVIAGTGLALAVDAVVASATCGVAKPARGAFEALAAALRHDVSGVLHIGDNPYCDAAGGVAAGGRALLARDPLDSPAITRAMELLTP